MLVGENGNMLILMQDFLGFVFQNVAELAFLIQGRKAFWFEDIQNWLIILIELQKNEK